MTSILFRRPFCPLSVLYLYVMEDYNEFIGIVLFSHKMSDKKANVHGNNRVCQELAW